jgi:hypothetical protein
MNDERPPDVLGSLPKTRPHRRSAKRGRPTEAAATQPKPAAKPDEPAAQPATARRKPPARSAPRPAAPVRRKSPARPKAPTRRAAPPAKPPAPLIGTAVQAAAELAEIGLSAGARAVREMLSRLPRP